MRFLIHKFKCSQISCIGLHLEPCQILKIERFPKIVNCIVLVSLLTLNIFRTFFSCFYCWFSTTTCLLGLRQKIWWSVFLKMTPEFLWIRKKLLIKRVFISTVSKNELFWKYCILATPTRAEGKKTTSKWKCILCFRFPCLTILFTPLLSNNMF